MSQISKVMAWVQGWIAGQVVEEPDWEEHHMAQCAKLRPVLGAAAQAKTIGPPLFTFVIMSFDALKF